MPGSAGGDGVIPRTPTSGHSGATGPQRKCGFRKTSWPAGIPSACWSASCALTEKTCFRGQAACLMNEFCLWVVHAPTPPDRKRQCVFSCDASWTSPARYNRLKCTDGLLFSGRYQAIVVEKDRYFLPLPRSIHRNPTSKRGQTRLI